MASYRGAALGWAALGAAVFCAIVPVGAHATETALETQDIPVVEEPERRLKYSVFGGVLTDNPWEQVVFTPVTADYENPGLIGVSLIQGFGPTFQTPLGILTFEVEAQIVRHFNRQEHWEFNLPVAGRLTQRRPALGFIDSFAWGIGPSYATENPPLEEERGDGEVNQWLVYWYGELAHNLRSTEDASVFLRLHHRSDGFGAIGGGSSNAVVVGFRNSF